jgi:hypothetical protein
MAEERENRYVANQETIGSTPVTTKAIADAIAQPRYTDDAYGELKLFRSPVHPLYAKSSKGFTDIIAPRANTDPANNDTQMTRTTP